MSFTLLFSVALVAVLGIAFKAFDIPNPQFWIRVHTAINRLGALVGRFRSGLPIKPSPELHSSESYMACLMHQLELTKTLQRVMMKTSQAAGKQATSRQKLQQSLELRMAMLTTEINAQEKMISSSNTDARPDWKTLQKGFGRILALHQKRFSPPDEAKTLVQAELDSVPPSEADTSPLEEAALNCTREIAALNAQLSHKQHRLGESNKRVKLLETKLSLAQKKIACLQWHIEQPDQGMGHAIETTPIKKSG